jgi:hypothetical protein
VDLETFMLFSLMNKQVRAITHSVPSITEKFWKNIFLFEFGHPADYFPDFEKLEGENNFERFKRAFKLYSELRVLARSLVSETIRNKKKHSTEENLEAINEYLAPYSAEGRECNPILASTNHVTIEFICF